jgi:hypothetical protein
VLRKLSTTAWAAITAALALAGAVLSLLFQLVPQLKPDPRENVGAEVSIYRIEPGVKIRDWLRRAFHGEDYDDEIKRLYGPHPSAQTLDQMNSPGELVYVRTTVDGYKHKHVNVRLRLYDAGTQEALPEEDIQGFEEIINAPIGIDAPSRRSVQLLWIPDLRHSDPTFVRVELSDKHGVLAVADSGILKHGRIRE